MKMSQQEKAMKALSGATIRHYCKQLRIPTVGSQFERLAEEAVKQDQRHVDYLEALLRSEIEERDERLVTRRIKEARLPRVKTLDDFDFASAPNISPMQIRELAEGGYITRCESVIFNGETGTGKTHLASALIVAACRQKRRARFTTAAELVNDLVEAQHQKQLARALARWARYELIVIDELGYVPLIDIGSELLFQVISDRAERAALIITTNLPFSEWTQVFTNPRLCKAVLDRVTDRATILETGNESYRFRRTLKDRQKGKFKKAEAVD